MLHVLFRVEEFPVQSLALLPRAIRQRLFNGLSRADILHLDGTALFSDLDLRYLDIDKIIDLTQTNAREQLVDVILQRGRLLDFISYYLYEDTLAFLDISDLKKVPDSNDELPDSLARNMRRWKRADNRHNLYRLICETDSFTSLGASLGPGILDPGLDLLKLGVIVPKHLEKFVKIQDFHVELPPHLAWSLIHYCNMHCAPKQLKINCYTFLDTLFGRNDMLWTDHAANPSTPPTDLVTFIQEFLSGVEELELGGTLNSPDDILLNMASRKAYVILYTIITSSQPHLKHLKVHDKLFRC